MLQDFCYWVHIDSYDPLIVDDTGSLVKTDWWAFERFFNNEFEDLVAAMEAYNAV